MPGAHSKLSPSSAHRRLVCLAALAMEEKLGVKNTSSPQAIEGTAAHLLGELALKNATQLRDNVGSTLVIEDDGKKHRVLVTQEMLNNVEAYVNYVESIPHDKRFVEVNVDYSHLIPDQKGNADCCFVTVEKIDGKPVPTLYVVDYKNGFKRVSAWNNPQGKIYALGALHSLKDKIRSDIKRIIIVIVQPRIDNISEFIILREDLEKWGEEHVKPNGKIALGLLKFARDAKPVPDQKGKYDLCIDSKFFKPGYETCFYCLAKGICKHQSKKIMSVAMDGFKDLTEVEQNDIASFPLPDKKASPRINTSTMTNEDLTQFYQLFPFIKKHMQVVEALIIKKLMDGEKFPDMKPIQKIGNTAWNDSSEAEIKKALRGAGLKATDIIKKSLISPTNAKDKIKATCGKEWEAAWDKIKEACTHRPKGEPAIAHLNHKSPSIAPIKEEEVELDFLGEEEVELDFLGEEEVELDFLGEEEVELDFLGEEEDLGLDLDFLK